MEITNETTRRISVVVCDEIPIIRYAVRKLVGETPDMSFGGEAATPADAIRVVSQVKPDVCVIEPIFPGASGMELIRNLTSRFTDLRILTFSRLDERTAAEQCLKLGARGFLRKQASEELLLAAIRRIMTGEMYLSKEVGLERLARMSGRPTAAGPVGKLSRYEFEVLQMIGQGMTTRQIAATLDRSLKTIETYRSRIKAKLQLTSSVQLTVYAVEYLAERGNAG